MTSAAVDLSSSTGLNLADYGAPLASAEAIGRRAGAKLLASEEARRAQEIAQGYATDDFSIDSRVLNSMPSPPNHNSSPIRQAMPAHIDSYPDMEPPFSDSRLREAQLKKEMLVKEQTGSSRAEEASRSPPRTPGGSAEAALNALKASRRDLGLGFSSPPPSPGSREPVSPPPKRRPPVSGVTREARQRSNSAGSTGSASSLNKTTILAQLADALKAERRRNKLYEEETVISEEELEYLTRETEIVKEKYSTRFEQQEQTIESLRAELEEVKNELETAYDLDPETAEQFLSLLSRKPPASKGPVVSAFAPGELNDSSPTTSPSKDDKSKPSKAKRRIDAHVAAHGTSSTEADPKLSIWRRGRKLSKSRPPLIESISVPTLQKAGLGDDAALDDKPQEATKPIKSEKRKPPVSGVTRQQLGEEGADGVRTRKRTNSFKKGLTDTLRVTFPSNAPSSSARPSAQSLYPDSAPPPDAQKVQAWLSQGARGADGRTKEVGAGYSNPFDER